WCCADRAPSPWQRCPPSGCRRCSSRSHTATGSRRSPRATWSRVGRPCWSTTGTSPTTTCAPRSCPSCWTPSVSRRCRRPRVTVAAAAAVGRPAGFAPLPPGTGERALNARALVAGGAALLVDDRDLTAAHLRSEVLPLVLDPERLASMSAAALRGGSRDAAEVVAQVALDAAGKARR